MTTTTLNVRGIDSEVVERLKRGSQARGWTLAQYLAALVSLHDAMRALADTSTAGPMGDRWVQVQTELEALGLATVSA